MLAVARKFPLVTAQTFRVYEGDEREARNGENQEYLKGDSLDARRTTAVHDDSIV